MEKKNDKNTNYDLDLVIIDKLDFSDVNIFYNLSI
jgi:hypothetical protein